MNGIDELLTLYDKYNKIVHQIIVCKSKGGASYHTHKELDRLIKIKDYLFSNIEGQLDLTIDAIQYEQKVLVKSRIEAEERKERETKARISQYIEQHKLEYELAKAFALDSFKERTKNIVKGAEYRLKSGVIYTIDYRTERGIRLSSPNNTIYRTWRELECCECVKVPLGSPLYNEDDFTYTDDDFIKSMGMYDSLYYPDNY